MYWMYIKIACVNRQRNKKKSVCKDLIWHNLWKTIIDYKLNVKSRPPKHLETSICVLLREKLKVSIWVFRRYESHELPQAQEITLHKWGLLNNLADPVGSQPHTFSGIDP